jgi:hypothetical protein
VEEASLSKRALGLALLVPVVGAAFWGASRAVPKTAGSVVVRGPYLQATTRHGTTIAWRSAVPTSSLVRLAGKDSGAGKDVGTSTLSVEHRVMLADLEEARTYSYSVAGEVTTHSFTTAPAPGAPFRALVFGDSGVGSSEQHALARTMSRESFDIVLHTGDIGYPDGTDADFESGFFEPYAWLLPSKTVFPTIGNHDMGDDELARDYCADFETPADNEERSKLYYSFTWGCAKFVSIESSRLFKRPGPHLDWLARELASREVPWLVLLMHVPLYSTGPHGDSVELARTVEPLLVRNKVDLVLAGHDHLYSRGAKDGWTYVVTGGGGAKLYLVSYHHPWPEVTESCHHYVTLDVSQGKIAGTMVRVDGSIGDRFEVAR